MSVISNIAISGPGFGTSAPVYTPDLVAGISIIDEASNLSTTSRKIDLSARPATNITIQSINITGATAKLYYLVFNATSDSEAATKLATSGQRFILGLGNTLTVAFATPVSRIDIVANVAETGTSLVATTAVGG
jgi:hypothetical protein